MKEIVDSNQYYSWLEIMHTLEKANAEEFETALYSVKIPAKLETSESGYSIKVPFPYAEAAKAVADAFMNHQFDYPSELFIKKEIPQMSRFSPVKHRSRASKPFLVLGIIFFAIFLVRILVQIMR